jgi:peptidoglycan/LPS O-acetylase OafA/YrhL
MKAKSEIGNFEIGSGKSRHIPTLDGWRALAILLVVAHHAGTAFYLESDYYSVSFTRFGTWGVPVFFGLSGVLITKLLLEEFDRTGRMSLKSFYIRRAFRILPPVFVYLAAVAVLGQMASGMEAVSGLFFFRNYLPTSLGAIYTGHLWSLAVEEHFYLIWPGLLVLVGARRGLVAAGSLSIALALWNSADFHWHLYGRIFPGMTSLGRSDLRLVGLFCGCTMAFLLHLPATNDWLRRYYTLGAWILVALAFPICLVYQPYLTGFWLPIIIPLLMVGTVLHPAWVISRVLDLKAVKWIGRISYSLYLWQQMFLIPSWEPKPFGVLQQWPFNILIVMICACASYYVIEKPLNRLGHRLAGRTTSLRKGYRELVVTTS